MKCSLRLAPACALAALALFATRPALAQQDSAEGNAPADAGASGPDAPAPGAPATLPGIVLERNVLVQVDPNGKPTSDQFIVVERRVLTTKGGGAKAPAANEVPTRFILVPQDSGADDEEGDEAPQQ